MRNLKKLRRGTELWLVWSERCRTNSLSQRKLTRMRGEHIPLALKQREEFLENQVDKLTIQKPESEVTEPQPQKTEVTNSSTVVSPQARNAEAAEPELASAELSEPVVAVESINSDLNSDVSVENTLDSQN